MTRLSRAPAAPDIQRREFLKTGLGAVAAAPFVLSGYGALMERRRFEIEYFEFPLDGLSGALDGSTIVQLTDLHVRPFMRGDELAAYVEAINRLEPDFVALTGDFIAGNPTEVDPCVEALSRLRAKRGVYACLGNHDVYGGIEDEITRRFAENKLRMLGTAAVPHRTGTSSRTGRGIDDRGSGEPDLSRALAAAKADPGEVRLLLSHRPEIFPTAAANGIEMVLSGHYRSEERRV